MDGMKLSGTVGLLVVAFVIFAVGTLFDPGEYILLLSTALVGGAFFALFLRFYFKRLSKMDEVHLIDATPANNSAVFKRRKDEAERIAQPDAFTRPR